MVRKSKIRKEEHKYILYCQNDRRKTALNKNCVDQRLNTNTKTTGSLTDWPTD